MAAPLNGLVALFAQALCLLTTESPRHWRYRPLCCGVWPPTAHMVGHDATMATAVRDEIARTNAARAPRPRGECATSAQLVRRRTLTHPEHGGREAGVQRRQCSECPSDNDLARPGASGSKSGKETSSRAELDLASKQSPVVERPTPNNSVRRRSAPEKRHSLCLFCMTHERCHNATEPKKGHIEGPQMWI